MKNTLKKISNKTTGISIFDGYSEFTGKMIDVSKECEQIQKLNPTEVYHLKNEIIMNSEEISDERKIELLDENQDKMIKDAEKSVGILERIMSSKLVRLLAAGYGVYKIYQLFVSNHDNDDGDDNNLNGVSEDIPCQDYQ